MTTPDQLTRYYDVGRSHPPAAFLASRVGWLGAPGSVRLQEAEDGGWDIVVRVDGPYTDPDEARYIADTFQAQISGIVQRLLSAPWRQSAYSEELTDEVCPACGAPAILARLTDRFFHADGSDNSRCWLHIARGDEPYRRDDR